MERSAIIIRQDDLLVYAVTPVQERATGRIEAVTRKMLSPFYEIVPLNEKTRAQMEV
ncbi:MULTISPECIES: hypothetical protein [Sporosarcina]|uniref:hypothetical protein n=1 Tax=Sporosarcina TaxID=1569 RepID=UPI0015905C81|nr:MULTISPECIES: hypothetical protein [Sporosarcina]MBY0221828.1 hypothetical protein [Sporosarcina aquimarina]